MASAAASDVSAVGPIHAASEVGFGLANNQHYEGGRPAYSDRAIDWILERTLLASLREEQAQRTSGASDATPAAATPPRVIRLVDLGAGTGIFTRCLWQRVLAFTATHRQLLDELCVSSIELLAIEPLEGMRRRFEQFCSSAFPELRVVEGSGAHMPTLSTGSVDIVFAATAFHWFATPEALRELRRVLRADRDSWFVPLWNQRDTSLGWVAALEDLVLPYLSDDTPRYRNMRWQRVFEEEGVTTLTDAGSSSPSPSPIASRPFRLAASEQFRGADSVVQRGGEDTMLARALSTSVIAALPKGEQGQFAERVRQLLRTHPDTKGLGGEYALPYRTDVYIYARAHA